MRILAIAILAAECVVLCGCQTIIWTSRYRLAVENDTTNKLQRVIVQFETGKTYLPVIPAHKRVYCSWYLTQLPDEMKVSWKVDETGFTNSVKVADFIASPRRGRVCITIQPDGKLNLSQ